MEFDRILQETATANATTPEHVYAEVDAMLQKAFKSRNRSFRSRALWKRMGFSKTCPTPEQFIKAFTEVMRQELAQR